MPALALYQLAAIARAEGHKVQIDESSPGELPSRSSMGDLVAETDLLCVSANSFSFGSAIYYCRLAKKIRDDLVIVLGGIHATYFPEHAIAVSRADIVVRGEAEVTFRELLSAIDSGISLTCVDGITFRNGKALCSTKDRAVPLEDEIEGAPAPCFDLIPKRMYRVIPVETSRGCSFSCTFCSIMGRRCRREISVAGALERIRHAIEYKDRFEDPTTIYFVDDCFTAHPDRAAEILERGTDAHPGVLWGMESRIEHLFCDSLRTVLERLRLWLVQIGVECGYDEGLRLVRKGISLKRVEKAAQTLAQGNIQEAAFSFILGLPWERKEHCLETLQYALSLSLQYGTRISAAWYVPFPGSEIWSDRISHKLAIDETDFDTSGNWRKDRGLFARSHPQMSETECVEVEKIVRELTPVAPFFLEYFQYIYPLEYRPEK